MGLECYRIGDLVLDAGTQEVKRDGTVMPIPRLSFKLLLALARHAPNVVSTDQLEQEVWEGLVVDRGTVNKRVLLLRKALSDGQEEDPYIAVIRGSGYRLIAPVERLDPVITGTGRETEAAQGEVERAIALFDQIRDVGSNESYLMHWEALLLLGSPAALDLDIDPIRDVNRIRMLAQVWNSWGTALRQDWRFKAWVADLGYENVWRKYNWPDRCKPTGGDSFECI